MNNTTKYLLIALVVIAIGAAVFFLWPKKKNENKSASNGNLAVDDLNDFKANNEVAAIKPLLPGGELTQWVDRVFSVKPTAPVVNQYLSPVTPKPNILTTTLPFLFNGQQPATEKPGFPLKEGSKMKEYVMTIQQAANQSISKGMIKSYRLVEDGIWGPKTTAAVKQIYPDATITWPMFQAIWGRVVSGQGLK